MARLIEGLNTRVNALADGEFVHVFHAVRAMKGPFEASRRTLRDIPSVPGDISARTATLLGERFGSDGRRELHRRYIRQYEGRSRPIVQYRVEQELSLEAFTGGDPAAALRLARRAASVGAWIPQPSSWTRLLRRVPLETARTILTNASQYPVDLVLLAENRADFALTSSVRPIASVAADEMWFESD
jgi:hypothetical protein